MSQCGRWKAPEQHTISTSRSLRNRGAATPFAAPLLQFLANTEYIVQNQADGSRVYSLMSSSSSTVMAGCFFPNPITLQ